MNDFSGYKEFLALHSRGGLESFEGKVGGLGPAAEQALFTHIGFVLEDDLQELLVVQAIGGGRLQPQARRSRLGPGAGNGRGSSPRPVRPQARIRH